MYFDRSEVSFGMVDDGSWETRARWHTLVCTVCDDVLDQDELRLPDGVKLCGHCRHLRDGDNT